MQLSIITSLSSEAGTLLDTLTGTQPLGASGSHASSTAEDSALSRAAELSPDGSCDPCVPLDAELLIIAEDDAAPLPAALTSRFAQVRTIVVPREGSLVPAWFSRGVNRAAHEARGQMFAVLGRSAPAQLDWVFTGVRMLADNPDAIAVTVVDPAAAVKGRVLFPSREAMVVRTEEFRALRGLNEGLRGVYDDIDFGWRANLAGHHVLAVAPPSAPPTDSGSVLSATHAEASRAEGERAHEASHSPAPALSDALISALAVIVRNADDTLRDRLLAPALSRASALDSHAVSVFASHLDELLNERVGIQALRVCPDDEFADLSAAAFSSSSRPGFEALTDQHAAELWGYANFVQPHLNVLVVTGDPISEKLAGPAIRARHIAHALSAMHTVRLVSTSGVKDVTDPNYEIVAARDKKLRPHTDWADAILFQGSLLEEAPWLRDSDKILIADIYDPMHLEQLEQAKDLGESGRKTQIANVTTLLNQQLARGDFFVCASLKQKDFWLGQLAALGRVNRLTLEAEVGLDSLISVVPFGVEDAAPVQLEHGIRGVVPGIGMDDKVIIWGGGIYNWFDPLTLVRAIDLLHTTHPDIRLYFMGLKHPNPGVPEMKVAWQTQELSRELGLTDRFVFFNSGWVPYDRRADVLLDADAGVSTHFEHVETALSFRTRILDYLWTGLPIVATTGDSFGNVLDSEGIGIGVPPEDPQALADALEKVLYEDGVASEMQRNIERYREQFRWSRALEPIVDFLKRPRRAPDAPLARSRQELADMSILIPDRQRTLSEDLQLVKDYWALGGPTEVYRRAAKRILRQMEQDS
ncbi:glycosyltransferase [Schaalia sp. ZJ405]|uniref:glycosyltransferase n=1 Tax=Schaalia sp. ZJ405 TaxID=2709403 RepID=UPI0013ECB901|nr:glycosyltransferase [Schaalia sp. ZJ405]QPK81717.1 glycosyltransferase [Schaalia sp. ZJ405]